MPDQNNNDPKDSESGYGPYVPVERRYKNTTLTRASLDKILGHIEKGTDVEISAQSIGVNRKTLYSWIKRGQQDIQLGEDTLYAELAEEWPRRTANSEIALIEAWQDIALGKNKKGNWQASSELLARKFPDRWSRKSEVKVEHKVDTTRIYQELEAIFDRKAEAIREIETSGFALPAGGVGAELSLEVVGEADAATSTGSVESLVDIGGKGVGVKPGPEPNG